MPVFEAFVSFVIASWGLIMKSLQFWSAWRSVQRSPHWLWGGWCIEELWSERFLQVLVQLIIWCFGLCFWSKVPILAKTVPTVFMFHGYEFCNICRLSHRQVCRVANCFIGNFWWGDDIKNFVFYTLFRSLFWGWEYSPWVLINVSVLGYTKLFMGPIMQHVVKQLSSLII